MQGLKVLVDSSVLLDVLEEDADWFDWSSAKLAEYAEKNTLCINPVIYAEISIGFSRIEELEEALPKDFFQYLGLPYESAFLAGKCFLRYRRAGGRKRSPLPDFFIGAHAAVENMVLLTRDARRYKTYFPGLQVVAP
jgi:predicted nucleic acid-binding protein